MSESLSSESLSSESESVSSLAPGRGVPVDDPRLSALVLSEERACARYLVARNAMTRAAARLASHQQLRDEQPSRADFRQAYYAALDAFNAAAQRVGLAHQRYVAAQVRTDRCWTHMQAVSGQAA